MLCGDCLWVKRRAAFGAGKAKEGQQMENSSPAKSLAAIATLSFGLRRLDSLMLLTNV